MVAILKKELDLFYWAGWNQTESNPRTLPLLYTPRLEPPPPLFQSLNPPELPPHQHKKKKKLSNPLKPFQNLNNTNNISEISQTH